MALPNKFSTALPIEVVASGGILVRQVDTNGVALDDGSTVYSVALPVMPVDSNGVNEDGSKIFSVHLKVTKSPNGLPVVRVDSGGTAVNTPLGSSGSTTTANFGALTTQGTGGVPVTGTSIVSGDPSGHWQISSGYLTPSLAGDTANLNAGPYALVFDDASILTVSIDANALDVRTTAEATALDLSATTTLKGKTIYARPDSYRGGASISFGVDGVSTKLKSGDFLGITFEGRTAAIDKTVFPPVRSADPCTVDKFLQTGGTGIIFRKLATTRVAEMKFQFKGGTGKNITGITIDQCHISGAVADPMGDYSTSTNYPNIGITLISTVGSASGSTITGVNLTNNVLEHGEFLTNIAISADGGVGNFTGNFCRYYYADALHLSGPAATVAPTLNISDNVFTGCVGLGADSGGPHSDACQIQGSNTATTDVIVNFDRNVYYQGTDARGHSHGFFADDQMQGTTDSGHFFVVTATGNLMIGDDLNMFIVGQAKNCVIRNNTVVYHSVGTATVNNCTMWIGSDNAGGGDTKTSSGTHIIERNAIDFLTYGGTPTLTNNKILGKGGATYAYTSAFDGPTFAAPPATLAIALARFSRKAASDLDLATGIDIGASGSGAVTLATTVPGNDGTNTSISGGAVLASSSTVLASSNTILASSGV